MTNREIVDKYLESGLIDRCLDYQFNKISKEYKEDYKNDLILELLEYDNAKMNDADRNGHFNALVTRIIQNNVFSKTSWYYRRYIRWDRNTDEITDREREIADE